MIIYIHIVPQLALKHMFSVRRQSRLPPKRGQTVNFSRCFAVFPHVPPNNSQRFLTKKLSNTSNTPPKSSNKTQNFPQSSPRFLLPTSTKSFRWPQPPAPRRPGSMASRCVAAAAARKIWRSPRCRWVSVRRQPWRLSYHQAGMGWLDGNCGY